MRTSWITIPVVVAAVVAGCGPTKPTFNVPDDDLRELALGNNDFGFDLLNKIAETEKGNIVTSPASVREALAMAYAGAGGQTKEEMKRVLRFTLPDDRLHAAMGATRRRWEADDAGATVRVANGAWGQKGRGVRPEFLALTKHFYDGGFEELDFAGRPEESRQAVNRWVAKRTDNRIADILHPGDIRGDTRLVLANAVDFRAAWAQKFQIGQTQDGTFTRADGSPVTVPMMSRNGDLRHGQAKGFELLELPYVGNRFAMRILLPARGAAGGLPTAGEVAEAVGTLRERKVRVILPRFRGESRAGLGKALAEMGMPTAFGESADFSGICPGLRIDKVLHAGKIAVDEEGTQAQAATVATKKAWAMEPIEFRADRPFYYMIVDYQTRAVLFLGRCSEPK